MKVLSLRSLPGANIHSHQGVVVMSLNLRDLKGKRSCDVAGFNRRLLEQMPELHDHHCTLKRPGGFVERLSDGTHFNHVVEHASLELLARAGLDDRHRTACIGNEDDDSNAVIQTTIVETTRFVMRTAADLVDSIIEEKPYLLDEKIAEAKRINGGKEIGPSTLAIVEAGVRRNIPWSRENEDSLIQLGYGRNLRLVQAAATDKTSCIAAELASNKNETKRRLDKFLIATPFGVVVRTEREALDAFCEIGGPVVVKPLNGRQGKGVSLNLLTEDDVIQAFELAQEFSTRVLVEETFVGRNYRVLVVDGKMVAASERLPCRVTSDGVHTIGELIEIENQNPLRGEGHERPLTRIKIKPLMISTLMKDGWTLADVPPMGTVIILCESINLSTGGTSCDVTDDVHFTVKSLCERAARAIDLDICGVDLVLPDIAAPVPKENGGVIEINCGPGLRMHSFPSEGKSRDVGGAIVEMLYPNNAPSRIPIIAITGTNGKTTTTRMTAHILRETGLNIGTATTDGILFNGESIASGDTTGPASAKAILGDKAVDIAVLETARGGILRRGLGWDWADVGVVTNITEDHIGQDGIRSVKDLVCIKSLVAERVRENGTLILNADDEESANLANRPAVRQVKKKIVYFALSQENSIIKKHLGKGGTAYFVRKNWICEARAGKLTQIVKTTSIPVTMGGTADFQIANAMAAIAAARPLNLSSKKISKALGEFRSDIHNPGRNNFYRVGKGYVLIDYGHNPKAVEAICRMTARWRGITTTGIISFPGDRNDEVIKAAGRIAAAGFNRIVIKGDVNLRGRRSGEIAEMLRKLVLEANGQGECRIVLDAMEAFEQEVKGIGKNEVLVFFYEKLAPVMEVLDRYNAVPAADFDECLSCAEALKLQVVGQLR